MYPNNDDTLNAGTQNAAQPNENTNEVKNTQEGKKVNLKDAATFVAGGVAGAGASVAANAIADALNGGETPDVQNEGNEPVTENPVEEEPAPAPHVASAPQPAAQAPEPPKPAETEEPRDPNIHQTSNTATTATTHTTVAEEEPAFYRENEVKIESIGTHRTDEGDLVHTATGTVNGHEAHFVDDGHGNVQGYAIDVNDNSEIEENEIVHAEGQNITMGNLAEHMVEVEPTPAPTPTGNIQVLAVANDVEMDGHTVNVAVIAHGETTGLMIDANQNGEVDVIAVDANHDDHYSEDETEVVTDAHMPMPTQDDVSPDMASNGVADGGDLPDYSNDSDITMYDV